MTDDGRSARQTARRAECPDHECMTPACRNEHDEAGRPSGLVAEMQYKTTNDLAGQPVAVPPEIAGSQREPNTLTELTVFVGTLALAYFSGWRARDLIWSLWLSSLCVGFLSVVVSHGRRIIRPDATAVERIFSFLGSIVVIGIFSIHFGMFHYIYAAILDLLMPLMDHPGRVYIGKLTWTGGVSFSFWATLGIALVQYWPVVLLNALRDHRIILSPSDETAKGMGPYYAILKLHFLIMGLGACYELGLDSFPVYAAVYTLLFSPARLWRIIFRSNKPEAQQ